MTDPAAGALRPLAGNPTVNYLKTFATLSGVLRTLAMDGAGNLYKESVPGTLTQFASGLAAERVRQFDDVVRQGISGDQRWHDGQ